MSLVDFVMKIYVSESEVREVVLSFFEEPTKLIKPFQLLSIYV